MEPLIHMFRQDGDFQATVEGLNRRLKEQMVAGLSGTARMVYVAALDLGRRSGQFSWSPTT